MEFFSFWLSSHPCPACTHRRLLPFFPTFCHTKQRDSENWGRCAWAAYTSSISVPNTTHNPMASLHNGIYSITNRSESEAHACQIDQWPDKNYAQSFDRNLMVFSRFSLRHNEKSEKHSIVSWVGMKRNEIAQGNRIVFFFALVR